MSPNCVDGPPEVLVLGAGPSGLTAAVVLAAQGVRARVVGREPGPTDQSRALVVQARTLELWDKLGLADAAVADGNPVTGIVAYSDGALLNRGRTLLDLGALAAGQTPYPFLLVFEQSKTEHLLLRRLGELGGSVEWGVEATGLRQVEDRVEVSLCHPDGREETATPRWVVGADGASSIARHALGLGFEGGTYEQSFFLADVAMTWQHDGKALYLALTDTGTFLFVPMPTDIGTQRYRVLGSLTPEIAAKRDLELADVQQAIDQYAGVRATVSDARWISLYRLHHRMAEHFRVGRVLLAGDAAHIHSPVGGQGMNTGIQDAYNLAWKLALVVRGDAREELLNSYEAERMPVARALVRGTDGAFNAIVSDRKLIRLARKIGARILPPLLARMPRRTRRLFATLSQIAISYSGSPAVSAPTATDCGPQPGERAPHADLAIGPSVLSLFTGPDHHLLVLPGPGTPSAASRGLDVVLASVRVPVQTHVIGTEETLVREAYGIVSPTAVLVRPDGHVAWRGALDDTVGLSAYLSRWFTQTPQTQHADPPRTPPHPTGEASVRRLPETSS